jgi:hypothetical protein
LRKVPGKVKKEYFFDPTPALPPDVDSFESFNKKPGPPRTPATRRAKGNMEMMTIRPSVLLVTSSCLAPL